MNIILLGPPGAGKGTQAKILATGLKIRHIASGELFRRQLERGTPLDLKAKEYMDKGMLVPDDLTISMVLNKVLADGASNGFVLDGFPRSMKQALALDKALEDRRREPHLVIYIKTPQDLVIKRLTRRFLCKRCQTPYQLDTSPPKTPGRCDLCDSELYQREDDKPEAVEKRLEVYERETRPLIDHYRAQGSLVEVDGAASMDEVTQHMLQVVNENKS